MTDQPRYIATSLGYGVWGVLDNETNKTAAFDGFNVSTQFASAFNSGLVDPSAFIWNEVSE